MEITDPRPESANGMVGRCSCYASNSSCLRGPQKTGSKPWPSSDLMSGVGQERSLSRPAEASSTCRSIDASFAQTRCASAYSGRAQMALRTTGVDPPLATFRSAPFLAHRSYASRFVGRCAASSGISLRSAWPTLCTWTAYASLGRSMKLFRTVPVPKPKCLDRGICL